MDNKATYPIAEPERRLRARARPTYSARRQFARYLCQFPVTVRFGSGPTARSLTAKVRDASAGGLHLEEIDIPSDVTVLRLSLKVPEGTMPEEFIHGNLELDATVCFRDPARRVCGVKFEEPLTEQLGRSTWRHLKWAAIVFFFLAMSVALVIKYNNFYLFWLDVPIFSYSIAVGFYLISRFVFASFYRRAKPLPNLPSVTVIAAVLNEEEQIERTIGNVMESAYPADRLQFIVVNDGSTDRTAEAIVRARAKYPAFSVITFGTSLGKRNALAAGIGQATGEFVVFIDSDSFLAPDALANLVRPFADPDIAAVTGHCEVENKWTNALTKMQAVRYFISFRVMKAAESVFDSVTCLSGPLAAYRRSVLDVVMTEWLEQTFMGKPATFGDDRSLTNSLLRRGMKVVYADDAVTTTMVPEKYLQFFRQQMRWKRSWFRETLRAASFMWRRPPLMSLSFYLGFILPLLGPAIVIRSLVLVPIFQHGTPLIYISGVFIMSVLMSTTYLFVKRSRLWAYGVYFCFFYMFVLIWQLPWAVLTFGYTKWGTRDGTDEEAP